MAKSKSISFQDTLKELTTIVTNMEIGDYSLEEALKQFERGVKLTRECQQTITKAQQQVAILIADSELKPFNEGDSSKHDS